MAGTAAGRTGMARACWPLLLTLLAGLPLAALELPLQAPLTSMARYPGPVPGGDLVIRAMLVAPEDAPPDLGVGAFVSDRHGRWFQQCRPGALAPGRPALSFTLVAKAPLLAVPDRPP